MQDRTQNPTLNVTGHIELCPIFVESIKSILPSIRPFCAERPVPDIHRLVTMLQPQPAFPTIAARAKFEASRTYGLRTHPPFAGAANADAENLRHCSAKNSAAQRIFPMRSLNRAESGRIRTALSPRSGSTVEERTKRKFVAIGPKSGFDISRTLVPSMRTGNLRDSLEFLPVSRRR